jgi:hypothetical protein
MIINDLDLLGVPIFEPETNPPRVVNAETPCARSVSRQRFPSIAGRHAQFFDVGDLIQWQPLAASPLPNIGRQAAHPFVSEYSGCFTIAKGFDH